ncbi:unnamed protein product [Diamesa hyperborea]
MLKIASRLGNLMSYSASMMAVFIVILFLSTTLFDADKNLDSSEVHVHKHDAYGEYGFLKFDLKLDMRDTFHWNVKEIFIFLTAEFETKMYSRNKVVLWDKVIARNSKDTVLNLMKARTKYFWDEDSIVKKVGNVTFALSLNIIPNAGTLFVNRDIVKEV